MAKKTAAHRRGDRTGVRAFKIGSQFRYGKISTLQLRPSPNEVPETEEQVERLLRAAEKVPVEIEPRSYTGSGLNPKMFEGLRY